MARGSKKQQDANKSAELIVAYARLYRADHEELKQRETASGASIAAQIRILVHEALRAQKTRLLR